MSSNLRRIRNFLTLFLIPQRGKTISQEFDDFVADLYTIFGDHYEDVLWRFARFDEYHDEIETIIRYEREWRIVGSIDYYFKSAIIADLE
jgi:hypothetical protein